MIKNYVNSSNVFLSPDFTPDQQKILLKYFTNLDKPVYAFTSEMPAEVAGALISRFSRTNKSPRELFWEEFLQNPDLGLMKAEPPFKSAEIDSKSTKDKIEESENAAKERAGKFFRQVLAKYGDESVAEITGVYVVVEKASTIAIKVIESMRRMAFIEQSTRYIDLTQKVGGRYEYFRDSEVMEKIGKDFEDNADNLYDRYREWFDKVKAHVIIRNPMLPEDTEVGYNQAIHSRACDILRELLPIGLRATVGIFGYGRDWSDLVNIMLSHNLEEVREVGKMIMEEVSLVIPNIMERTAGPHGQSTREYLEYKNLLLADTKYLSSSVYRGQQNFHNTKENIIATRILTISDFPEERIAAGIAYSQNPQDYEKLFEYYRLNRNKAGDLLNQISDLRKTRFDKVPDAFEKVRVSVEFTAPWSCWKDIQRHRRLTEIHNPYFINNGFYSAPELKDLELDEKYSAVMKRTLSFIANSVAEHPELSEKLEYLVPHGANFRWTMDMDFAEVVYMTELRSIPSGHMTYRTLMHTFYNEIKKINPNLANLIKFIDLDQYYLGRRQSYNKVVQKGASLE